MILHDYKAKYDTWIKVLLALPIVALLVLGYLFFKDGTSREIFSDVLPSEARLAAWILFASSVFVVFIYFMVLLRRIYIQTDRLTLKIGPFLWHVLFPLIEEIKPYKGLLRQFNVIGFVTSYRSQVEIVRKKKMNIRISVENRDEFLEYLKTAISEWNATQSA